MFESTISAKCKSYNLTAKHYTVTVLLASCFSSFVFAVSFYVHSSPVWAWQVTVLGDPLGRPWKAQFCSLSCGLLVFSKVNVAETYLLCPPSQILTCVPSGFLVVTSPGFSCWNTNTCRRNNCLPTVIHCSGQAVYPLVPLLLPFYLLSCNRKKLP